LPSKKPAPITVGLEKCLLYARECAEQAYRFAPSSYTYDVLIALTNAAKFLPPIREQQEEAK
jgi:hypothetical protein